MKINPAQIGSVRSLRPGPQDPQQQIAAAREVQDAFTKFVGATFYGQMLKSMRSTVDKPAYFHGGRGEEAFRGQLDQILADSMTEATADQFTGPMFRQEFPQLAQVLENAEGEKSGQFDDLALLRRM